MNAVHCLGVCVWVLSVGVMMLWNRAWVAVVSTTGRRQTRAGVNCFPSDFPLIMLAIVLDVLLCVAKPAGSLCWGLACCPMCGLSAVCVCTDTATMSQHAATCHCDKSM